MTDKDKIIEYKTEDDIREDLDFIRGRFEGDGLAMPESLSADAMRQMLEQEPAGAPGETASQAPAPKNAPARKRYWRIGISIAACAVLAIGLIPFLRSVLPGSTNDAADPAAGANGLVSFESYKALDHELDQFLSAREDQNYAVSNGYMTDGALGVAEDAEVADQDMPADGDAGFAPKEESLAASGASGGSEPSHSETYVQVEGIDEADIVKTDGNYIYYLSSAENQIIIAKAKNGKTKRVSAIPAGENGYIHDIFVHDDQLIVIAWDMGEQTDGFVIGGADSRSTAVTVYDISDRTDPKQADRYTQSGDYLSSRLIGDQLCLVTNKSLGTYRRGDLLPQFAYGDGKTHDFAINDIYSFPEITSPAFTVVGSIDLSTGKFSKDSVRTKAVLGCSEEIYCSGDNLYVTGSTPSSGAYVIGTGYDNERDADADADTGYFPGYPMEWKTQVLKVSLADGKVRCLATATVDGSVNDQFSMDEKDGILRIATTSNVGGTDVNNLFLLDKKMKELGACRGFARDEHIEAVRYIRDKAYVITYEQTDPLFIIDLSDPTNPVIEGHVKISGFSTLLVPCDAEHMLGLGFSTETTEFGEATDGVKLALFDISDPSAPAVADSKEFPDMYSQVQYDHKALLVGPNADYYAIPYERYVEEWIEEDVIVEDAEGEEDPSEPSADVNNVSEDTQGILVFSAKAGTLEVLEDLKTKGSVSRCIYIDDYIYGICDDDSIEGFRIR